MKRIIIFLMLLLFWGCKHEQIQTIDHYIDLDNAPDIRIDNMNSFFITDRHLKLKIIAPEADYFFKDRRNPNMQFPKGFKAVFYNEKVEPISTIKADYAIYYEKLKLWKISGNVEVVNQKSAKLKTQELYFDEEKEKIFSIKFVEVYDTSGSLIRGKGGFISNLQFTHYEFKNVDGIIVTYNKLIPD